MYCKHCGKEIDDNSSFCKYCGKPQDNRVSVSNGTIDFVINRPFVLSYIFWAIINIICLCSGEKVGYFDGLLYPKFKYSNSLSLEHYQITDFFVYTIFIPLVIFLGYHYFKKVKSIKYRIFWGLFWGLWFIFNILWYNWGWGDDEPYDCFFPFAQEHDKPYYYAYDLSELFVYTMLIPIIYWGYLYYKNKKSAKSN